MIRCNLAVLLAERALKITKVSLDTGISRTTLTALAKNTMTGVQLETINALCSYLGVETDDLFPYIPFDLAITNVTAAGSAVDLSAVDTTVTIAFAYKPAKQSTRFFVVHPKLRLGGENAANGVYEYGELTIRATGAVEGFGGLENAQDFEAEQNAASAIGKIRELPQPFLTDLEVRIGEELLRALIGVSPFWEFSKDFEWIIEWDPEWDPF